jgi:uncharacterized protein YidB (DUF937 family)
MSVSSVDGSSAQFDPSVHRRHKPLEMTNTAKLLGMSTDDLEQARKSGETLTDLAADKGVSKDDLLASISEDLKANKPDGAPDLTDGQLTKMATSIADGKRPHRGAHGPRGGDADGDRSQSNVDSLAKELGINSSTLLDALNGDGFDVSSLLGQSGYGLDASAASGLAVDRYA